LNLNNANFNSVRNQQCSKSKVFEISTVYSCNRFFEIKPLDLQISKPRLEFSAKIQKFSSEIKIKTTAKSKSENNSEIKIRKEDANQHLRSVFSHLVIFKLGNVGGNLNFVR